MGLPNVFTNIFLHECILYICVHGYFKDLEEPRRKSIKFPIF